MFKRFQCNETQRSIEAGSVGEPELGAFLGGAGASKNIWFLGTKSREPGLFRGTRSRGT